MDPCHERQHRLVDQMLLEQVRDENKSRQQCQRQHDEACTDQSEHHSLECIQKGAARSANPRAAAWRNRRSRNTRSRAVTAAANNRAAGTHRQQNMRGQLPARHVFFGVGASRTGRRRTEGGARQQNGTEHAVLFFDAQQTGQDGERPGEQRQRLQQTDRDGPSRRIMCTIASECAKIAANASAQAMGPRRGLLTLRSMTQALEV